MAALDSQRALRDESRLMQGMLSPQMVCPHCQWKGCVRVKRVKVKQGISGGKATGALLTGGVSLLATGLSRKSKVSEAYCTHCFTTWQFA